MIFNFNRGRQFTTSVELKKEPLEIVNEVKLLGVVISDDLKWHKNTNYLTQKGNRKMRMLHIAAKFTKNREHLKHIYKTFIRSNLEFSSTVWHSSLSVADRQDLERVQKSAVKVILGKDYRNYEEALSELKLDSLNKRREHMALKFVKKSLENDNFSKLFPLKEVKHGMKFRKSEKYFVTPSNTKRRNESAVPYLQGLLNKDYFEKKKSLKRLLDIESSERVKKTQRIDSKKRFELVNYVSNVDVIT